MMRALLTFGVGFVYDFVGVRYMMYSVDKMPKQAALLSMWLGAASLLGLQEAFSSTWCAVALIAGYGAGTYVATRYL